MTATEQRFQTAPESIGPGAYLRAAREAAGWSVEQAAQQLKLAPRQVKALEDEDFAQLPGRTFARGFVRNYARLLNLDAEALLALLPDATQAPGLGAPPLHSTSTMMGELPSSESAKPNFARWLIPFVLIGCIVAAASYEWYRGRLSAPSEPVAAVDSRRELAGTSAAPPAGMVAPPQPSTSAQQGSGTPLPNPLAVESKPADVSPTPNSPGPSRPSGASDNVATNTMPAASTATPQPAGRASAPQPATAASAPQPAAAAAIPEPAPANASSATLAASQANAPLVLTYRGPSWTEVKDGSGQVLIARLVAANSVQPINGTPPFHIVLGNARAVGMAYRGKSIDLARYTRQNVARLTLR